VPPNPPTNTLHQLLLESWAECTLVKIVLSAPRNHLPAENAPLRIKARPIRLRSGWKLSIVECFARNEITRNYPMESGLELLANQFCGHWGEAHLFTLAADVRIRRDALGAERIQRSRPSFTHLPEPGHDQPKVAREALSRQPFLHVLGVTQSDGKPRAAMASKLRQISRFVELISHLFAECGWALEGPGRTLRIADMGAGRGYLTFALAHLLREKGWPAEITGVEQRADLVTEANRNARALGWEELRFETGTIGNWEATESLDVLVALHACDTATDDALFRGIRSGASLLVTSPCCHKQIRPQLRCPPALAPALGHGILEERFAEILTDGIRALALQREGYSARVFEFIEPEHTGKNLMLSAVRSRKASGERFRANGELESLLSAHGIRHQRLVDLLKNGFNEALDT
jgi:hypothetical protein